MQLPYGRLLKSKYCMEWMERMLRYGTPAQPTEVCSPAHGSLCRGPFEAEVGNAAPRAAAAHALDGIVCS